MHSHNPSFLHDEVDEDFFRITAHDSGKLIVNALFSHDAGNIES